MENLKELKKIEKYAAQCMKCGFCSFFCPVYQEEHVETGVARGKNYLVREILAGRQEFTDEMGEIIGKCLLCKRCVANCPSKTQIDRVVVGRNVLPIFRVVALHQGLRLPQGDEEQKGLRQVREAGVEISMDFPERRRKHKTSP